MLNSGEEYKEGTTTKLYIDLNYELTDVITWENSAGYTQNKPDDGKSNDEKNKTFELTSKLTYTFR